MNSKQLELLLTYISNEIQLQALRGTGMSWQVQSDNRENLTNELRKSVTEVEAAEPNTIPDPDPDPDVRIKNKFSPLMIDMLLFIYHSGHNLYRYPALHCPAQQQALRFFIAKEVIVTTIAGGKLTRKGKELVHRILNTPMPE